MTFKAGVFILPHPESNPSACEICNILNQRTGKECKYSACTVGVGKGGNSCLDSGKAAAMTAYLMLVSTYKHD